jgi:ADP-glucose pyrophosphorylase
VRVLGGSFIGASTHLNSGAVISNSLLMNNCLVGENCVIQNSVLGFGVAAGLGPSSEMWRPLLRSRHLRGRWFEVGRRLYNLLRLNSRTRSDRLGRDRRVGES